MKKTKLNPGIVKTVQWLNSLGFLTTDSGDGETHDFECDLSRAYVHITVRPGRLWSETQRLKDALEKIGQKVVGMDENNTTPNILAQYNPTEEFATISLFNVKL